MFFVDYSVCGLQFVFYKKNKIHDRDCTFIIGYNVSLATGNCIVLEQ
jgi:hypothetical protein